MAKTIHYFEATQDYSLATLVAGLDRDVARGEDVLMLGLAIVMLSSSFAPIAPPKVLLPLVALTFAITSSLARWHYHNMERKWRNSLALISPDYKAKVYAITSVFIEQPMPPLSHSYNLLKNWKRTVNSILGGMLINPLWMPIFYTMGIQIVEEKNLAVLNKAVIAVEDKLGLYVANCRDTE
jgi:hypothetical protein